MSTNIEMSHLFTRFDLEAELAKVSSDIKKIKRVLPNTRKLSQAVYGRTIYCALELPRSLEGVCNRFIVHHSHYLRYFTATRAFAVNHTDKATGIRDWRPVSDDAVKNVLLLTIHNIEREKAVIQAAADLGLYRIMGDNDARTDAFIKTLTNDPDRLKEIFDALKHHLSVSVGRTGAPLLNKDDRVSARNLATKKAPHVGLLF